MLNLTNLKPVRGSRKRKMRVGRGTSSGHGKTCGRGHKGQTSRAGGTKGARFEGGQTPLYRRLPKKRGFNNILFRKEYEVINLNDLNKYEGEVNLIKPDLLVKVLGEGELKKALKVTANKFSQSAKAKIEKAGGSAIEHP
ncbi:50S ribosomal protein L15 [Candidatus Saganbacteria bacterium]|nr:50S ribosomal protein L15 [Candidatus Saganbacteria bacterium]